MYIFGPTTVSAVVHLIEICLPPFYFIDQTMTPSSHHLGGPGRTSDTRYDKARGKDVRIGINRLGENGNITSITSLDSSGASFFWPRTSM